MADSRLNIDEREEFPFASGCISIIIGLVVGGVSFVVMAMLSNWSLHLETLPEPQIIWIVVGVVIPLGTPILLGVIATFVCISRTKYGSDVEEAKRYMDKAGEKSKGRWLASISQEKIAKYYRTNLYSLLFSGITLHVGYYARIS